MASYLRKLFFAIGFSIFLIIALIGWYYRPIVDTDFGWHYRCGLEWWQTNNWCFRNHYSYFLSSYVWQYSTLLYDALIVKLWQLGGFRAISWVGALVLVAVNWMWYQRYRWQYFAASLLILWTSLPLINLGFRPQLLTVALAFIWWLIMPIDKVNRQRTWQLHGLWWGLLVIWINTHPGVVLFIVAYLLLAVINIYRRQYDYLLLAPLTILISCLSPQGFGLYWEVLRHTQANLGQLIAEWVAPDLQLQALIIGITSLLTFWTWKRRLLTNEKLSVLLILVWFFAMIALTAERQVVFWGLALAVLVAETKLPDDMAKWLRLAPQRLQIIYLTLFLIGGLINLSIIFESQTLADYCQRALVPLPCQELRWLPNNSSRLFTAYEWGGLLIWQKPKTKVFVDGRMPAWDSPLKESPYSTYLKIIQGQPGWEQVLKQYHTDSLFIPTDSYLSRKLGSKAQKWQLLKRNEVASYYVRRLTR